MKPGHPGMTAPPIEEDNPPLYFGEWVKRRRQELDLTQVQLAQRASCTVFTVRKIEVGERKPSRQLAGLLAQSLEIPAQDQAAFLKVARGELGAERLPSPARTAARNPTLKGPLSSVPTNLPRALTPFIGREPELSALHQLLADPHCLLLTIVGPGGIGKTRLAIEAARCFQDLFPDGVWFIPLAALNSPALLVSVIADSVNLQFQGLIDHKTQLLRHLCQKKSLLVLDNAEHLLDGVGLFLDISNACPQVKLLVTSRERLNLLSEWVFEILGLPVPSNDQVEHFEAYSSIALFLQSARRANPDFVLDQEDRAGVADICRLVEGMPLAIELSAAWARMLSKTEIAAEIKCNLDFLSTSARDIPERHRSIRAVFDHSWQMLSTEEQRSFFRLSVFRGGFSREAAEQVAGIGLNLLSAFVAKSLVQCDGQKRFSLHELIRQYAAAKPQTAEDLVEVQRQHIIYFTSFAEKGKANFKSPSVATWIKLLELENDNLRAALGYAITLQASQLALRLSAALRDFWEYRGYIDEGRHWLNIVLGLPDEDTEEYMYRRGQALNAAGGLARIRGDFAKAHSFYDESLALRRKCGDRKGIAATLNSLGVLMLFQGKYPEAEAYFQESLQLYRELDLKEEIVGRLNNLGIVAMYQQNYETALLLHEECIRINQGMNHRHGMAGSLGNLGDVLRCLGQYDRAMQVLEESRTLFREIGDVHGMVITLASIARVYLAQGNAGQALDTFQASLRENQQVGDWTEVVNCLEGIAEAVVLPDKVSPPFEQRMHKAVRLLAAADRLRSSVGDPRSPVERDQFERITTQLCKQLSEHDYSLEWKQGFEMTADQAVEFGLYQLS